MSQPVSLLLVLFVVCVTLGPVSWFWVSTRETAGSKLQAYRIVGVILLGGTAIAAWQTDVPIYVLAALLSVAAYQIWQAKVCGSCLHVAKVQWMLPAQYCSKCGTRLEPDSNDDHAEPLTSNNKLQRTRGVASERPDG